MSILLRADGTAALENVPGGQWVQTDSGICWEDTQERYSGEATWTVQSHRGVELTFGESDVIIWAEPGRFGEWTWSGLEMVNCSHDNVWLMSLVCGRAGSQSEPACKEPEASILRP